MRSATLEAGLFRDPMIISHVTGHQRAVREVRGADFPQAHQGHNSMNWSRDVPPQDPASPFPLSFQRDDPPLFYSLKP